MLRRALLALCAIVGLVAPSQAQEWPSRPIRVIVPFGAGGTTDLTARLIGPQMAQRLGQPWVVENRPGAGGNVGSEACARAAPDGYTLCVGTISSHAINNAVYASMPYDNLRDFMPVAMISLQPNALFVTASLPANNVAELVALMKAKPGSFNYASSGVGTSIHLAGTLFTQLTGTEAVHVPYRSSGQLMTELIAGNVQMAFDNLSSGLPHVRDGKIKILGVAGPERVAVAPDVPTVAETLPGFTSQTWGILFAPADTSPAIITRVHRELSSALVAPEVTARFAELGIASPAMTPDQLRDFVAAETARWGAVARKAGIKAE